MLAFFLAFFHAVRGHLDCPICFEAYNGSTRQPLSCVGCGNSFCQECVDTTRQTRGQCSMCRRPWGANGEGVAQCLPFRRLAEEAGPFVE